MKFYQKYPEPIFACTLILVLLGVIATNFNKNSLLPKIKRPEIMVVSQWPGKSQREIEQILVSPLENQLQGLANLKEMTSQISKGVANTLLTFHPNTDMKDAYTDVLARVSQIPNWPSQISAPKILDYSKGAGDTLATFFLYGTDNPEKEELIEVYKNYVLPEFSKIEGVSLVEVDGTPIQKRVDIEFDATALARLQISPKQVIRQLKGFADRSAGEMELGSRSYTMVVSGQRTLDELNDMVIVSRNGASIPLSQVATTTSRIAHNWSYIAIEGHRSLYFITKPTQNSNSLKTIEQLKELMNRLNAGLLKEKNMELAISRDDSIAIKDSLNLVYGSLIAGVLFVCLVMYFFLKSILPMLLVCLSIPVSVALVMLAVYLKGGSVNVISLAGLALSLGLILDASIIVVESIFAQYRNGASLTKSLSTGVKKVKTAVISSTLSSVLVFVPIIFIGSSEGQLFHDLAFVLSSSLLASMFFSLLLLPALFNLFVKKLSISSKDTGETENKWRQRILRFLASRAKIYGCLIVLVPVMVFIAVKSLPALDVLPNPKQNIVLSYINLEHTMSLTSIEDNIVKVIDQRIEQQKQQGLSPDYRLSGMFCEPTICVLYFYPYEDFDYPAFKDWVDSALVHDFIGTSVYTVRGGLLRFAMPNNNVIKIDIKGSSLPTLQKVGQDIVNRIQKDISGVRIKEVSALSNADTQIQFRGKEGILSRVDISHAEMENILLMYTGGLHIGNYYSSNELLPFYLTSGKVESIEQILNQEVSLDDGKLMPLSALTDVRFVNESTTINRVNRELAVTLELEVPPDMAMESFTEAVEETVNQYLIDAKMENISVAYRGNANSLRLFVSDFFNSFVFAVLIVIMLLWFQFRRISCVVIILMSMFIPISAGAIFLSAANIGGAPGLDMVTMMGFIILLGLAINNSILLMEGYLEQIALGESRHSAIAKAVAIRIRPIYMSSITSIVGMIPLVVSTASSSEIYRGLAIVIIGGLLSSMLLSPYFMSSMLSLKMFKMSDRTAQ